MKIEYKVDVLRKYRDEGWTGHDCEDLEALLNERASDGWHIAMMQPISVGWLVIFSRLG